MRNGIIRLGIYAKKALWDWRNQFVEIADNPPKDLTFEHIGNWLTNAEGVFEAFELDCTLHNLDASDYFLPILCEKDFHKMAEGLVNFQDDATKDRLFKQLSEMMLSYR